MFVLLIQAAKVLLFFRICKKKMLRRTFFLLSAVSVGLRSDSDMRFEEAVEERHIVEAQTEGNLFDLQVGNLQLGLGVGNNRLDDDVSRGTVSDGLDGRAQVRQRETHRFGVLAHVMPFVVVLENQLAVVLIDLGSAVKRLNQILVLLTCVLGITRL